MSATIDLTESQVLTDLGNLIVLLLPGVPVVRGLVNRAAMPLANPGFICMTPMAQVRLATNVDGYTDLGTTGTAQGTTDSEKSTRFEVSVDFYGASSAEWAAIVSTVLRGEYACQNLTVCQPLYADDPVQLPLIDGEEQYEERWRIRAALQYNPTISTPMQFGDTIPVTTIYPPVNT